jgi:site-specific recombinase XerC
MAEKQTHTFQTEVSQLLSGRSIRRHLSSVRGFLSYLLSRKIIPSKS